MLTVMITQHKDQGKMVETQKYLNTMESMNMILTVFSDEAFRMEPKICKALLVFGIALLQGGNQIVQATAYNYFITFPRSSAIFEKLQRIVQVQIELLKLKGKDLYEAGQKDIYGEIMELIMRFFQLFTEGHNNDLQKYLRFQHNAKRSYDMISLAIELSKTCFDHACVNNFDNIMATIDTLIEFVQGPCVENQHTIVESKYLEYVNEILMEKVPRIPEDRQDLDTSTVMTIKNILEEEGLTVWMKCHLKYKCMILLTSLIEMKTSDAIVRKIMQFIPKETLINLLIECFRGHLMLYDYRYSTEAFKHGDVRPDNLEFDGDREADLWYETIIETGFMCYFMLWEYLEVEGFTDQQNRWYDEAIQLRMSTLYKTDGFLARFIAFMGLVCRYIWGLFTCCFRACRKRQVEVRMYHPDHM
jgi:hypothetical protein